MRANLVIVGPFARAIRPLPPAVERRPLTCRVRAVRAQELKPVVVSGDNGQAATVADLSQLM
jgi:hypothetical protein